MKILNKFFIAILLLMCLPLTTVYSFDNNIQRVGFDIGEFEGIDGGLNPPAPELVEGEDAEERPDNPTEYDPDNPYAEWER